MCSSLISKLKSKPYPKSSSIWFSKFRSAYSFSLESKAFRFAKNFQYELKVSGYSSFSGRSLRMSSFAYIAKIKSSPSSRLGWSSTSHCERLFSSPFPLNEILRHWNICNDVLLFLAPLAINLNLPESFVKKSSNSELPWYILR